MSQKNDGAGLSVYIPMILTAAFLLGCFAIALTDVRENAGQLTAHSVVSRSDGAAESGSLRKKSAVKDSGGLRYRWVSASDTASDGGSEAVDTAANVWLSYYTETSSETPVASEEEAVSSEEGVSLPEPVSNESEPEPVPISSEEEKVSLRLPNEHYINFTPPKEGHIAYLTFDDGPSSNTEDILDILDYYNVKATFFVIYHKDMADKYKAIVDRGHTIALHTYSHDYAKIYRSEKAFFNDLARIDSYVYSVTGVHSKIMRFPGGSSNTVSRHYSQDLMPTLKESATKRGYAYHDWNVDSEDAAHNNLDPDKIVANVKRDLTKYRKPDILMHDSGGSKRTTVEALPEMIEYIYAQGYKMEGLQLDSYAVHHNF